jgi:hypothetical protein
MKGLFQSDGALNLRRPPAVFCSGQDLAFNAATVKKGTSICVHCKLQL